MSTLSFTQYCHVHFNGVEMYMYYTCNPLYTTKEFFWSRFINEYYAFVRWRYFTTTTRILFVFSFHVFFNSVIPGRSKALISTRKRNPEDSGRSSKMASACQYPFSFFLLASSFIFYFNHWGTLQSSAVVSYDIINIDKKLNLFALQQKIEFGLRKRLESL